MFGTLEPWGYGGYGQFHMVVWIILAIAVVPGSSGACDQALRDSTVARDASTHPKRYYRRPPALASWAARLPRG